MLFRLNKLLTNDAGGTPDWVMLTEGGCDNHGGEVNMVVNNCIRLSIQKRCLISDD